MTAHGGTFRTWSDVRLESFGTKADSADYGSRSN
jgi:hypothetical protein